MATRCQQASLNRGAAAFLINGAIAAHRIGERRTATENLAIAARLQHTHGDVSVFANQAVASARLAAERGDLAAAPLLLDEAITAAQGLGDADLLGEAWSVVLDLATQTGDIMAARRALLAYGEDSAWSPRDHFPAALARWQWARGKLDDAVLSTDEPRQGYGGACVAVERARLLLNGKTDAAVAAAQGVKKNAQRFEWADLNQFAELVIGARGAFPIAPTNPWSLRRVTAAGRTSTSALCTSTPFDGEDVARTSCRNSVGFVPALWTSTTRCMKPSRTLAGGSLRL